MFILCAVKQIFRGLIIDSTRLDSSRSRMWGERCADEGFGAGSTSCAHASNLGERTAVMSR